MKKLFSLILALMASITFANAEIYNGLCGTNLTWSLNTEDSVLTIEGTGVMDNWQYEAPWCSYYTLVKYVVLPEGLISIGNRAFLNCSSLISVAIPNSVTSIRYYTFEGCSSLTSIEIPNSVTSIEIGAFSDCSGLTSMTIPDSVTTIAQYTFSGCSGLTSVTIPNSVTGIGSYAFYGCSGLTSIDIPNSVRGTGYYTFSGCTGLTSIKIPNGVKILIKGVFANCTGLTSIEIPNSVTSIEGNVFEGCSSLTSIEIPNSVTSIGGNVFEGCSSLTSIEIPNSVTSIGDYAFSGCTGLKSIICKAAKVPTLGKYVFLSVDKTIPLYVPATSIRSYKETDQWKDFMSILPISTVSITFLNWDGSELLTITVGEGSFPNYTGSTPTRPEDDEFTYTFSGWTPGIVAATSNATYTATFTATRKSYTITWRNDDNSFIDRTTVEYGVVPTHADPVKPNTDDFIYTFTGWSPEIVAVTGNATYTATYSAKHKYSIILTATNGTVTGGGKYVEGTQITIKATPNYGYHFVRWSDGNTDNPRTIVVTKNLELTVEFAVDKSGTCGKNNLLQWTFANDGTLTISGRGELTENYTYGVEAPTQMKSLIVGNEVTAIGDRAFYGKSTLQKIVIGSNVTSIGNYAFADINHRQLTSLVMPAELLSIGDYAFSGNTYVESIDFNAKLQTIGAYAFNDCYRVAAMTCLATTTPDLGTNALTSISSYASLCVPAECLSKYRVDPNWGRFDLCTLGSAAITTDTKVVIVEPSDNTAVFTWPTENSAASYSLQITKDGVVFCTLVFNNNGQLTGIAFAPSHDNASHAPAATVSVAGMSFTVTGLNSASKYAYHLSVRDANGNEVQAYSGEFATNGYTGEVNHGGEPEINTQGIEDVLSSEKASKILRDGKLFILRGDHVYTPAGQLVK